MPALDFAVDALAVHRITRLVSEDTITRPLRARIIRGAYRRAATLPRLDITHHALSASEAELDALPHGDDEAPKLAALVTCPWCVSVYVAAGVIAASRFTPGLWRVASYGLALSSVAALIANREEPKR
jgi:hypothetical protein